MITILTRKKDERIVIDGGKVEITVVDIRNQTVQLRIKTDEPEKFVCGHANTREVTNGTICDDCGYVFA